MDTLLERAFGNQLIKNILFLPLPRLCSALLGVCFVKKDYKFRQFLRIYSFCRYFRSVFDVTKKFGVNLVFPQNYKIKGFSL